MSVALILLFLLLGAGAGTVHFVALFRDAGLRGGSPLAAMALRLGRVLLTIAVLIAAARLGWPVLLGALAGFMVARQVVMRRLGAVA